MPFMAIIIVGVIGVLSFQIVGYFREKRERELENKAAIEIVAGKADLKIWTLSEWEAATSGGILHEGDSLRTAAGSRVVMTLLNGTKVRLNSDTEIELTGLKTRDGEDELALHLKKGEVWIARGEKPEVKTAFSVTTEHIEVTSLGTIFNVSDDTYERVQVVDGKVQALVRVPSAQGSADLRIAETLEIALGQEISIGEREIQELMNRQVVSLVTLLSDSWRNGEWYSWNRAQDAVAKDGVSVADAVASTAGSAALPPFVAATTTDSVTEVVEGITGPEIIGPTPAQRTTKASTVLISGTVSKKTEKIEVTTFIAGKSEHYFLIKYKPNSPVWSYTASRELGNLLPGENRYSFVALDSSGTRSENAEIVITLDVPKFPVDLSAPKVVSVNGEQEGLLVNADVVEIRGTIGKGIVKLVVNDFPLTRYVPDSGVWTYIAKKEYGNLTDGENKYSIYGVAYDGRKTPVTVLTVSKIPNAPGEE